MDFKVAEFSHIGDREENQDYFCHVTHSDWGCFMVADGLGGHEAGDIASKYFSEAVASLSTAYADSIQENPVAGVEALIHEASQIFRARVEEEFGYLDTQTTFTLAWVTSKQVITAHIGDSRVYRINKTRILWRSPDDTMVQVYFDQGKITEEDMLDHPEQNHLLKTINTYEIPEPTINTHPPLKSNQALLLCTDGFWTQVNDKEKIELVHQQDLLKHVKEKVIEVAKTTHESDNVTVQVVCI